MGKIAERARELIRHICKENEVAILAGHVSPEHIHLLVFAPPHLSASKLVQYIENQDLQENQRSDSFTMYEPDKLWDASASNRTHRLQPVVV